MKPWAKELLRDLAVAAIAVAAIFSALALAMWKGGQPWPL